MDLTLNPTFDDPIEKELFDIMYSASKDGILEPKRTRKNGVIITILNFLIYLNELTKER